MIDSCPLFLCFGLYKLLRKTSGSLPAKASLCSQVSCAYVLFVSQFGFTEAVCQVKILHFPSQYIVFL